MKLIVAVDETWGIGKNGDLLLSIPDDMRYFREKTRRAVLVMGYNTLLSFPNGKPLPNRMNLVLADIEGVVAPGTVICDSMEQLFSIIRDMNADDIFVIGGGYTYRQFLPYCDTAYITKMRFSGDADTFIPNLDELEEWRVEETSEEREHEGVKYCFVTYVNDAPKPVGFSAKKSDMPRYFVKKEPVTIALRDHAAQRLREDEKALLHAYFRPLERGVGAEEVAAFLSEGDGDFEAYLLRHRLIADENTVKAMNRPDEAHSDEACSDEAALRVTIGKEKLALFDEYAQGRLSAAALAERCR